MTYSLYLDFIRSKEERVYLFLLIMRHGDALPNSSIDFDRLLSPLGEEQGTEAGEAIKRYGVDIQHIFCSPLPRAKKTAELVAATACSVISVETWHELAPGAECEIITAKLGSQDGALIVTHQPFAGRMVFYLTGEEIGMSTGTVACIQAESLDQLSCELKWLIPELPS